MKLAKYTLLRISRIIIPAFLMSVLLSASVSAQSPQLSLADLLIGLRSKKVTLPERNKILGDAVKERGITFMLTPEIEKELTTGGADAGLMQAIRDWITASKPAPPPPPTPPPPDFSFYQKRADRSALKGEFTLALADYNKALEMRDDEPTIYLGRGKTHFSMKSYDLSVADYDKALSLNPKEANVYYNRGITFEKMGDAKKAMDDYQKAFEIDPKNASASAALKRLQDELGTEVKPVPPPVVVEPAKAPEFLNLGNLSAANAVRMVQPTYPAMAQKSNIEGRVTVDVELDADGNVVKAKANNGNQMLRSAAEVAAKRSKFKPAMFNEKPIKSIGSITYNFSLRK